MTTIKDIARLANVSVATVSRVINKGPKVGEQTRLRVQQIMDELGYQPNANARALVTSQSNALGLVLPEVLDPFFAALAHGMDGCAKAHQRQLLISTGAQDPDSERNALAILQERQCQSIVIHSKFLTDEELIELSQRIQGLVLINRHVPQLSHRSVWLDNVEGGKIAARHLLALNHQQIAVINSNFAVDDPKRRLQGIQAVLKQQGLTLAPELIITATPDLQGGEQAAQALIATGLPFTAIFAYNDAMAIGAISTLEDNGFRVPQDVSVIGFDDVLLSRYSRPKLTTLNYPILEMATQAGELALTLATAPVSNGQTTQSGFKYLPQLIRRESTLAR